MKLYVVCYDDGDSYSGILAAHLTREGAQRTYLAKIDKERKEGKSVVEHETCATIAHYVLDIREIEIQPLPHLLPE